MLFITAIDFNVCNFTIQKETGEEEIYFYNGHNSRSNSLSASIHNLNKKEMFFFAGYLLTNLFCVR